MKSVQNMCPLSKKGHTFCEKGAHIVKKTQAKVVKKEHILFKKNADETVKPKSLHPPPAGRLPPRQVIAEKSKGGGFVHPPRFLGGLLNFFHLEK